MSVPQSYFELNAALSALYEQVDKLVFAENEVTTGLLNNLADVGIRSINVVPDEEYETALFSNYLKLL